MNFNDICQRLFVWSGRSALVLVLVANIACVEVEDVSPTMAVVEQTIINGSPDPGYPAVGAFIFNGNEFCSGTLVSDRIVVTAAH